MAPIDWESIITYYNKKYKTDYHNEFQLVAALQKKGMSLVEVADMIGVSNTQIQSKILTYKGRKLNPFKYDRRTQ